MKDKFTRRNFIKASTISIAGFTVFSGSLCKNESTNTATNTTNTTTNIGENKMAYEWVLNKRPYSDDEAKTLLANVMDAETSDWHYNTHQKGYVTALNTIEGALENADRSKANGNYSDYGELKRRFTWNHAGALLHDVYWQNLGGDGDMSKGPDIAKAIEQNFGSADAWKTDFKAAAVSAKLSGWGVLTLDQLYSGRLINIQTDEHHYGGLWGGIPLICCDVFEHAYYHKDGPARAKYIDNFINNLHWGRINDRYKKYAK